MIWVIAIGWVIYLKYMIKDQIIVSWCSYEVSSCNNLLAAYIAYVQHPSSASLSFFFQSRAQEATWECWKTTLQNDIWFTFRYILQQIFYKNKTLQSSTIQI